MSLSPLLPCIEPPMLLPSPSNYKDMKMFYLLLALGLSLGITAMAADTANKSGTLYHVVSFKFKETAKKEDIKKVEEAFRALKTKIPQISSLEWGTNVSP